MLDWKYLLIIMLIFQIDNCLNYHLTSTMQLFDSKKMGQFENTLIFFASDNGASAEIMVRNGGHDPTAPSGSVLTPWVKRSTARPTAPAGSVLTPWANRHVSRSNTTMQRAQRCHHKPTNYVQQFGAEGEK